MRQRDVVWTIGSAARGSLTLRANFSLFQPSQHHRAIFPDASWGVEVFVRIGLASLSLDICVRMSASTTHGDVVLIPESTMYCEPLSRKRY